MYVETDGRQWGRKGGSHEVQVGHHGTRGRRSILRGVPSLSASVVEESTVGGGREGGREGALLHIVTRNRGGGLGLQSNKARIKEI